MASINHGKLLSELKLIGPANPIVGRPTLQGSKNIALPIIAAATLVEGPVHLENVPNIQDTRDLVQMLQELGCEIEWETEQSLNICCRGITTNVISGELSARSRGSLYATIPAIKYTGTCTIGQIGGDNISGRSLEKQKTAYEGFGLSFQLVEGGISIQGTICEADFDLNDYGITSTCISLMLAAICNGTSIIHNVSREPEILVVMEFLERLGVHIKREGRDVTILAELKNGYTRFIIPNDRIVTGTWILASISTGGYIHLSKGWDTNHLSALLHVVKEMGASVSENDGALVIDGRSVLRQTFVQTGSFPMFDTDLLPQFTSLLATANGTSLVTENLHESRFEHVSELRKLGANIERISENTIRIIGPCRLKGAEVRGSGIRETAALIIAGFVADGITTIYHCDAVFRGYEKRVLQHMIDLGNLH